MDIFIIYVRYILFIVCLNMLYVKFYSKYNKYLCICIFVILHSSYVLYSGIKYKYLFKYNISIYFDKIVLRKFYNIE